MSTEFGWSFGPKIDSSYTTTSSGGNTTFKNRNIPSRFPQQTKTNKRRFNNIPTSTTVVNAECISETFRIKKKLNFKKLKNGDVSGKPLPVTRMIEIMNKQDMVDVLTKLVQERPDLNEIIETRCKSSINVEKCIAHLDTFLKEKIIAKLPFGVDCDSEYSFLRVEKNLVEFYQILSDFILNYLPPVETNISNCLTFINDTTYLIHKIPFFKINSYNMYHFTNIYDRLVASWWSVLRFFTSSSSNKEFNVYKMSEFDVLHHLDAHSRLSECPEKFEPLVEFLTSMFASYSNEYTPAPNIKVLEGDHADDVSGETNGKKLLINEIMYNEDSRFMGFGNNSSYTTSTTTETFT